MKHIGLFEGIGGFSVAAHWAGWETIAWCEYASFPQKVLRYHFPNADELHDVTTADFTIYRNRVDVLTGGFPCQPFSHAGQRRGTEDDRYLWPHMQRAITECRPTWVIAENVAGITSMAFPARALGVEVCATVEGEEAYRGMEAAAVLDSICDDLKREGYDVQPIIVPACAVNAPHRRDRIWIIGFNAANRADARAENLRCERTDTVHGSEPTSNANERSRQEHGLRTGRQVFEEGAEGGGHDAQGEAISRPLPHASSSGPQQPDQPAKSGQLQPDGQPCHEPQPLYGRGAAANAQGGRAGGLRDPQGEAGPREGSQLSGGGSGVADEHGNAADTDLQRPEECDALPKPSGQERQHRETHRAAGPGGWENFPTQSPICGRDDGFSDLLDIDTLFEGKKGGRRTPEAAYYHWRNETIKAYGNAIVPQVFYEIAKAINAVSQAADQ